MHKLICWLNKHLNRTQNLSLAYDEHLASNRAGGVPAEQVVALLILGVAGSSDDLIALHLAFTSGAPLALIPAVAKTGAVDLYAADASPGVSFGAGD